MDQFILFGAAALLLRVGLGLYLAGISRAKNSAGIVMRAACDLFVAVLAFWAIGAAIFLQDRNGFFAISGSLVFSSGTAAGPVMFLAAVVAIAGGAVVGAVAERSKFFPMLAASVLLGAFVVPVAGKWAWSGWLARIGFTDVGGASFIHLAGGLTALAGAVLLGPRDGKYHRDGSTSMIPGHSVPMAGGGVMVLLAGWVPYVAGCAAVVRLIVWPSPITHGAADLAAINVLMAAAAGGLASLLFSQFRYGKPDISITSLGVLGALVAISAGAGVVATPWAVIIGAGAGVLVPMSAVWIDLVGKVDDPAGSIAIHAIGGSWGILSAGLFAPGSIGHRLQHFGVQVLGLIVIGVLSAGCGFALFALLKATTGLRAPEADEFDGLDLAQHDIGAYPDFQQNSIRSYHLREA
jgi:Amt family ammonium transporter